MSDRKGTIIHLMVGLTKKTSYKNNIFLSRLEVLEEILTLKLIFPTMQQKLI